LEGLLEIVGLEVMAEGVRAGTHSGVEGRELGAWDGQTDCSMT